MTFELPLSEARVKPHQVTAMHLLAALAMTGIGAVLAAFHTPSKQWSPVLLAAGILLLFTTLLRNKWIQRPKVGRVFRIMELAILLFLAVYFAMMPMKIPAAMCSILAAALLFSIFWEQQNATALVIKIDEAGIRLPITARRRQLGWPEVEQVLFRFGTLTINCYDNRLFQWTIGKTEINKEAFNQFCEKQVKEGYREKDKDKDKDDW